MEKNSETKASKTVDPPGPQPVVWNELPRKEQDKIIREYLDGGKLLVVPADEIVRCIETFNQLYLNEQMLRFQLKDMSYQWSLNIRILERLKVNKDEYAKMAKDLEMEDRAEYEKQQLGLVPAGAKELKLKAKETQGTALIGLDGKPI